MKYLNELNYGDEAKVGNVLAKGSLRRRFTDIGIIEGTNIKCVAVTPQGDPKAFLIRGAVIAIRNKDSALVRVMDR